MGPITACFFNLLTVSKKLQSALNFCQNESWKLLEIIPADLLDTLLHCNMIVSTMWRLCASVIPKGSVFFLFCP